MLTSFIARADGVRPIVLAIRIISGFLECSLPNGIRQYNANATSSCWRVQPDLLAVGIAAIPHGLDCGHAAALHFTVRTMLWILASQSRSNSCCHRRITVHPISHSLWSFFMSLSRVLDIFVFQKSETLCSHVGEPVAMPKVAVNENGNFCFGEDDVRFAWQLFKVFTKPQASLMEFRAYREFQSCILPLNT